MTVDNYFPKFHPHTGELQTIPVFVSSTQIFEVQEFLKQYDEDQLVTFYKKLESLDKDNGEFLLTSQNLFPTDKGTSHRAALGELFPLKPFALEKNPTALLCALVIIIKLNQILRKFHLTFDRQLLTYSTAYSIDVYEVADVALAISDAFGEFKLATGNIKSSLILRQNREREILSHWAQKAVSIKNQPLQDLQPYIFALFDTERLVKKAEFIKQTGAISYSKIAEYIFWERLSLKQRMLYPSFKAIVKKAKDLSPRDYLKVNPAMRFNPTKDIAKRLKQYQEEQMGGSQ